MGTVRVREVRFRVHPQDHEPRHAHGLIGSGYVIVDLRADRTVAVADRSDATRGVTRSEIRKVLTEAEDAFDAIVADWEKMQVEN